MSNFIAEACISLRPTAGVSIDENGIHWHGVDDIPTQQEIEAEALRLQAAWSAKQTQPTTDEIIAALVARVAALESRT